MRSRSSLDFVDPFRQLPDACGSPALSATRESILRRYLMEHQILDASVAVLKYGRKFALKAPRRRLSKLSVQIPNPLMKSLRAVGVDNDAAIGRLITTAVETLQRSGAELIIESVRSGIREAAAGKHDRPSIAEPQPLYQLADQIVVPERKLITEITPRIQVASAALAERLKKCPEDVHNISPREFEFLVAELLTESGGQRVYVTRMTRDGGKDLLAYIDHRLGTLLCLVETKKHRPDRPVGVELVRSLFGTLDHEGASHATLVTTSTFSTEARQYQSSHPYRLSLRDYAHLSEWIRHYGTRRLKRSA